MAQTFEEFIDKSDLGMDSGTQSIQAGKWEEIGSLQVGAQTAKQWGIGVVTDGGLDSRKSATVKIYDSNGDQFTNGKLRLRIADANENREQTSANDLLNNWSNGRELGVFGTTAREDDKLKVEINGSVGTTLDFSNSSTQADFPTTTTTRR